MPPIMAAAASGLAAGLSPPPHVDGTLTEHRTMPMHFSHRPRRERFPVSPHCTQATRMINFLACHPNHTEPSHLLHLVSGGLAEGFVSTPSEASGGALSAGRSGAGRVRVQGSERRPPGGAEVVPPAGHDHRAVIGALCDKRAWHSV